MAWILKVDKDQYLGGVVPLFIGDDWSIHAKSQTGLAA